MNQKALIEHLQGKEACVEALEWLRTQPDPKTSLKNCPDVSWLEWMVANALPKHSREHYDDIVRPAWTELVQTRNVAYLEYDAIVEPLLTKVREGRESGQPLVLKVAVDNYTANGIPAFKKYQEIRAKVEKKYDTTRMRAMLEAIVIFCS